MSFPFPITVRPAAYGDESAVASLLQKIHTQHVVGRPDLFGGGRPKFDEESVRLLIASSDCHLLVAEQDGAVCGYALSMLKTPDSAAQGQYTTLYIDDIHVATTHRRLGIGSLLLDACKTLAEERGCYNITLNVWAFNEGACAFYEKNGFTVQRMIMERLV